MIPPALVEQWEQRWDVLAERFVQLRPDLQPTKTGIELDMPNFGYETSVYESKEHPGWWIANFDGTEVGFCGTNAKENAEKFIASLKEPGAQDRIDEALIEKWKPISEFTQHSALWPIYDNRENRTIMSKEVQRLQPPITMEKIVEVFSQLIMDRKIFPKRLDQ